MKNFLLCILLGLLLLLAACSQAPQPTDMLLDAQATESQKLVSSDGGIYDFYGSSVSVDGNLMVIGAPGHNNRGAAYLYQKTATGRWQFLKKLVARDGTLGAEFGRSVSLSGTTIVVGAKGADISGKLNQGSAYLFERNRGGANNWGEVKKLLARDGLAGDEFGSAVAVGGDIVIVGANLADIGTGKDRGSTYLFARNQGGSNAWGQVKKLVASDGAAGDGFGSSVAISGVMVVVGAPKDKIGSYVAQGSAYLFERDRGGANAWGQLKLFAAYGLTGDEFGNAVAVKGNTVVVAAWKTDRVGKVDQGVAYLFERNLAWRLARQLVASDSRANASFGSALSMTEDTVVVGAEGDHSGYVFKLRQASWGQTAKLTASPGNRRGTLGNAAGVSGNTVVLGNWGESIGSQFTQGSAYVYKN